MTVRGLAIGSGREDERIEQALGERVVRLEHVEFHVGAGLAAKPRIDILLVVGDSSG